MQWEVEKIRENFETNSSSSHVLIINPLDNIEDMLEIPNPDYETSVRNIAKYIKTETTKLNTYALNTYTVEDIILHLKDNNLLTEDEIKTVNNILDEKKKEFYILKKLLKCKKCRKFAKGYAQITVHWNNISKILNFFEKVYDEIAYSDHTTLTNKFKYEDVFRDLFVILYKRYRYLKYYVINDKEDDSKEYKRIDYCYSKVKKHEEKWYKPLRKILKKKKHFMTFFCEGAGNGFRSNESEWLYSAGKSAFKKEYRDKIKYFE